MAEGRAEEGVARFYCACAEQFPALSPLPLARPQNGEYASSSSLLSVIHYDPVAAEKGSVALCIRALEPVVICMWSLLELQFISAPLLTFKPL